MCVTVVLVVVRDSTAHIFYGAKRGERLRCRTVNLVLVVTAVRGIERETTFAEKVKGSHITQPQERLWESSNVQAVECAGRIRVGLSLKPALVPTPPLVVRRPN